MKNVLKTITRTAVSGFLMASLALGCAKGDDLTRHDYKAPPVDAKRIERAYMTSDTDQNMLVDGIAGSESLDMRDLLEQDEEYFYFSITLDNLVTSVPKKEYKNDLHAMTPMTPDTLVTSVTLTTKVPTDLRSYDSTLPTSQYPDCPSIYMGSPDPATGFEPQHPFNLENVCYTFIRTYEEWDSKLIVTSTTANSDEPVNRDAGSDSRRDLSSGAYMGSILDLPDSTEQRRAFKDLNDRSDTTGYTNLPVDGVASSTLNECISGKFRDIADTATAYLWKCVGTFGGSDKIGESRKPVDSVVGTGSVPIGYDMSLEQ